MGELNFKLNIMYVKQYDKEGNVKNPITKENPFVNKTVKQRFKKERKKAKLIIMRIGNTFFKYKSNLQLTPKGTIEQHRLVSSSSFGMK